MFKKLKAMENGRYSVEISRTRKHVLISAVNCQKNDENYLIELDRQRADLIIKEFNNDMNSII